MDLDNSKSIYRWCPERDSNSHTSRYRLLRPGRLPIPPSGHIWMRAVYSKHLGQAYETDRSPDYPQYSIRRFLTPSFHGTYMVPLTRIELVINLYQRFSLPLAYKGLYLFITLLHCLYSYCP